MSFILKSAQEALILLVDIDLRGSSSCVEAVAHHVTTKDQSEEGQTSWGAI